MRYIVIFIAMLIAIAISGEYTKYMKKRVAECEAFASFIAHVKTQVGCFLRPCRELADGFSSDALEKVGFLNELRESGDIYASYVKAEPKLSLSEGEREVLDSFFSSLGGGYLDEQMKLIELCLEEVESARAKLREESPKSIKLISTLSVTGAIGFLILII